MGEYLACPESIYASWQDYISEVLTRRAYDGFDVAMLMMV